MHAGFFVVILSESWLHSKYCQFELQYALELRLRKLPITIIPVAIDEVSIPEVFESMHVLRAPECSAEGLLPVIDAIRGEKVRVLLDNSHLRITAVRQGSAFDDATDHASQTIVTSCRSNLLFVFVINSVGHPLEPVR